MNRLILTTTALTALATTATAGGIERTTQSTAILFEEGRYMELGLSAGFPSVSGVGGPANPTAGVPTGNMTEDFLNFGISYKADLNDTWSYAIIYDQPFGADVFYPTTTGYIFGGSNADFTSHALTGIVQYNMGNGGSVFGGLRAQSIEAEAEIAFAGYTVEGDRQFRLGYVLGAAYEKPEIALRVALTYNSAIDYELDTFETSGLGANPSQTDITTPQSLNLEFQTGVAEDTLVFGSVRWVEWSEFNIAPDDYLAIPAFGGRPLVEFADDRITYTIGVGRRINEQLSLLGSVSYEETTGSITGNLGPTDGFASVGLGAIYRKDNMKVTAGVRYVDLGNANTTANGVFTDNSAVGAGVRVGWSF